MNGEWLDFYRHTVFGGNTAGTLAIVELIFLGVMVAGLILTRILKRLSRRFHAENRAMAALTVDAFVRVMGLCCLSVGCLVAASYLQFQEPAASFIYKGIACLVTVTIGAVLYWMVEAPVNWFTLRVRHNSSRLHEMVTPLVRKTLRVTIFIFGIVQIAQILSNTPVTTILAGLGVGGLAVALAAQETLKNFFGSMVLAADRPFEIGDRIQVDAFDGPVESVGMRSTRLRTSDGHLVTIPNGELANKSIRNIGKRPRIHHQFILRIVYGTPPAKVRRAIAIIEDLLKDCESLDPANPPHVTFTGFSEWSLNLQVQFDYIPPEYWKYMAFTQELYLQILERFHAEGIEFAFPTQTQHTPDSQEVRLGDRREEQSDHDPANGVV